MARHFMSTILVATIAGSMASCGGGGDEGNEEVELTIGPDGEIVEVDEVDELAPFDPALQQLIYHLNLDQAEEFVRRYPSSLIFDVRPKAEYEAGHLPGATHVDWRADQELFQFFIGQLPREDKYMVYGSVAMAGETPAAIALLRGIGFRNLFLFLDHYEGWQNAGLPFEQGPDPDPLPLPDQPEQEEVEGDADLAIIWALWRRANEFVKQRDAGKAGGDGGEDGGAGPAPNTAPGAADQ